MADVLEMAAAERADLADLLESLTPEQWERPSLCADWSVRQVAAHVIGYESLGWGSVALLMLRNGLRLDRANAARIGEVAAWSPERIVAEFRSHLRPHGVTAAFGGRVGLTDCVIHQQDIRRPLGLPRTIPADRLRVVLDFAPRARALPAPANMRGLGFAATDLDWSHGDGPEVRGQGEVLLLAAAGRVGALDELTGDGVEELARRVRG